MAYGKGVGPYTQLYFDSSRCATRRRGASSPRWATTPRPTCGGSSRPREIMRLYRTDPSALRARGGVQSHKASAEEVLHPAATRRSSRTRSRSAARGRRASCARSTAAPRRAGPAHRPEHGRAGRADRAVAAPVPRPAPAGARDPPGVGAATRVIAQPTAHRHEHGARRTNTSACSPRPTTGRPRTTRCTPRATPSTSPAVPLAAPRRWPSSGSSTAWRRGGDRLGPGAPGDPHHRRVAGGSASATSGRRARRGGLRGVARP